MNSALSAMGRHQMLMVLKSHGLLFLMNDGNLTKKTACQLICQQPKVQLSAEDIQ